MNNRTSAILVFLLAAAAGLTAQSSHSGGASAHGRTLRTERDFVEQMALHHQEAIDTAILIKETATDVAVRRLAEGIVSSQSAEVLLLREYFARWYNGMPSSRSYKPMMRDLTRVTGSRRTVQFVEDMIAHHEGAVAMAEKVLTLDSVRPETRGLAQAIIAAQAEEIAVMKGWLASRR